jgi:hypothetical protein
MKGTRTMAIIEGPEKVRVATLLSLASALSLEIVTGLKLSNRGTALDAARIQGVIPEGQRTTRKAALEATVTEIEKLWPDYTPTSSVARALGRAA